MRIFQVITLADIGGAQMVLLHLTNKLIDEGHEVIVISEFKGPMWELLPESVIKERVNKLKREINFINDSQVLIDLIKLNKKYKPDVIHLHSSKIGLLGRLAFPSRKLIYTVHGFDSIRIGYKKFILFERILKNFAKYIVGVSNYDLELMKCEGIVGNTTYIFNGIEDPLFQIISLDNVQLKKGKEKLQEISDDGFFIVMCIARLSPQKKFDLFSQVAHHYKNKKVMFVWVGNQYEPEIISPNIICLGNIPKAHFLIKHIDLMILTSNYEGLPVSIIEALAYGVPVIASKVGGIQEILNGDNGFAVENHVNEFVRKIDYFYNNTEVLNLAKIESRKSYLSQFTINKMYSSYLELYKKISE